jgi:hypothetical protein
MADNSIKQILINPELFNVTGRKNRNKTAKKGSSDGNPNNTTMSRTPKNKILKHIQSMYNKDKSEKKKNILKNLFSDENQGSNTNNEFDASVEYLLNMTKDAPTDPSPPPVTTATIPITIVQPTHTSTLTPTPTHTPTFIVNNGVTETPKFGCLKNGVLPTYSNDQKMIKNPRSDAMNQQNNSNIMVKPIINISNTTPLTNKDNGLKTFLNMGTPSHTSSHTSSSTHTQYSTNSNETDGGSQSTKRYSNTKILRRTHRLGKSNKDRKVGVLISNKTIRNQITNKMKQINQIPIGDIKKYLIKKGLIRVGSIAPNDILREMYRSVVMLCGDLQNHNTQNIMYNYLHKDKT